MGFIFVLLVCVYVNIEFILLGFGLIYLVFDGLVGADLPANVI